MSNSVTIQYQWTLIAQINKRNYEQHTIKAILYNIKITRTQYCSGICCTSIRATRIEYKSVKLYKDSINQDQIEEKWFVTGTNEENRENIE